MTSISSKAETLNIVVPMAGRGARFQQAGFTLPKPLIPVLGQPMVRVVIDNVRPARRHRFIFLAQREAIDQYGLDRLLRRWAPGCEVFPLEGVTEGAACTVLLAKGLIDNAHPLMIVNSDQYVEVDINDYLAHMERQRADGMIMTMWADHPKWSYVRFGADGLPCEVVEKQVVSNEATVGIYNYRHGADFVAAAERMIAKNLRVNNEFYVAPAYNEMLAGGARLCLYNVGRECAGMYGLGTPEDYAKFPDLASAHQLRVAARAA